MCTHVAIAVSKKHTCTIYSFSEAVPTSFTQTALLVSLCFLPLFVAFCLEVSYPNQIIHVSTLHRQLAVKVFETFLVTEAIEAIPGSSFTETALLVSLHVFLYSLWFFVLNFHIQAKPYM